MKQKVALFLAALFAVYLCGCSAAPAAESVTNSVAASSTAAGLYVPGTYTASAPGRNGDVTVEVVVSENRIESVAVSEHQETAGVADAALEQVPAEIVEAQSTDVDAASGATITSTAICEAVAQALRLAQGGEAEEEENSVATAADIIVVGAGGAGLSAGAAAGENGSSVIILEANSYAGGATLSSGGHMLYLDEEFNTVQPRNDEELEKYLAYDEADFDGKWAEDLKTLKQQIQEYKANGQETGRFDSIERVMVDHYVAGSGTDRHGNAVTLDYNLIRSAVEQNMEVYTWLNNAGMEIKDSLYKSHANSPVDSGAGLVNALVARAEQAGCDIQYSTRALELVETDGKVTGVKALNAAGETVEYTANKAVILATGGFAANGEMAAQYQDYGDGLSANVGTTNPKTNVGDGIVMAQSTGAQLRDMQFITTVLMGYHSGSTLAEAGKIMGTQQLVVNAQAERFADESSSNAVQSAMNDQTDALGYLVGDKKMIDALNAVSDGFVEDLISRGWAYQADTLEEAAQSAGLDPAVLAQTVEKFNSYVAAGNDADFGRTEFNGAVEEGPFLIVKMEMHYHLTFGGLVVNDSMQVLDSDNDVINGLYAAGDILSGFEGDVHQSGDCLSIVVTSGITAGRCASENS